MSRSAEAMALRREAKFERHAISIRTEHRSETRGEGDNQYTLEFHYAVYVGKQLIGRTTTKRSALKLAHQWARNHG